MDRVVIDNPERKGSNLETERLIVQVMDRIRGKDQQAGEDHDDKAREGPQRGVLDNLPGGLVPHSQTEQAQVNQSNGSDRQSKGSYVETFGQRKGQLVTVQWIRVQIINQHYLFDTLTFQKTRAQRTGLLCASYGLASQLYSIHKVFSSWAGHI